VRDLVRAQRQAKDDLTAAKLTLLSFLLRQGRRFPGRSTWSRAHWRWLGQQAFAFPHHQLDFGECTRRIEEAQARCDRLDLASPGGGRLVAGAPRSGLAGFSRYQPGGCGPAGGRDW